MLFSSRPRTVSPLLSTLFSVAALWFGATPPQAAPKPTSKTAVKTVAKLKKAAVLSTRKAAPMRNLLPYAKMLDPNLNPYPRSSLHSFADLLEAPAGKRGFLSTQGEH